MKVKGIALAFFAIVITSPVTSHSESLRGFDVSLARLAPFSVTPFYNYSGDIGAFRARIPYQDMMGLGYLDTYKLNKSLFTAQGQKLLGDAQKNCVVPVFRKVAEGSSAAVIQNIPDYKDWVDALGRNNAGRQKSTTPVTVFQGLEDKIVPPAETQSYAERARSAGNNVPIKWVTHAGHRGLFTRETDIIASIDDGFKGQQAVR